MTYQGHQLLKQPEQFEQTLRKLVPEAFDNSALTLVSDKVVVNTPIYSLRKFKFT